jgi:hypothetical protein
MCNFIEWNDPPRQARDPLSFAIQYLQSSFFSSNSNKQLRSWREAGGKRSPMPPLLICFSESEKA